MDYTHPGTMTRDAILSILNKRQLKVENMEALSYEDLLRIYRTFAIPLPKRESTSTCRRNNRTHSTPMDVEASMKCCHEAETEQAIQVKSANKKRLCSLADEYLSTAAKRIKITWN